MDHKADSVKFYVASSWGNRAYIRDHVIPKLPGVCVARWPTRATESDDVATALNAPDVERRQQASDDLEDINKADVVYLFTDGVKSITGGMWFEAGYAVRAGKKVYRIGPSRSIFDADLEEYSL